MLGFLVDSSDTSNLHDGNSPLLDACNHRGTPEILNLLAFHGADFSGTNFLGETALHVMCRRGHANIARHVLESMELLKELGARFTDGGLLASLDLKDGRVRRPGEARDIDVGVHDVMAVQDALNVVPRHDDGGTPVL